MANTRELLIGFGKQKQTNISTANLVGGIWRLNKLNVQLANPNGVVAGNDEGQRAKLGLLLGQQGAGGGVVDAAGRRRLTVGVRIGADAALEIRGVLAYVVPAASQVAPAGAEDFSELLGQTRRIGQMFSRRCQHSRGASLRLWAKGPAWVLFMSKLIRRPGVWKSAAAREHQGAGLARAEVYLYRNEDGWSRISRLYNSETGVVPMSRAPRHKKFPSSDDPQRIEEYEQEVLNAEIARKIYALRTRAGFSQRALAKKVGTTASVICRLEDAD